MNEKGKIDRSRDDDDLRLLGLSRIPRCMACPRFLALKTARELRSPVNAPWPPVPVSCRHQICAPMIDRFARLAAFSTRHAVPQKKTPDPEEHRRVRRATGEAPYSLGIRGSRAPTL